MSKYVRHGKAFYILPQMFSTESDLPLTIKQSQVTDSEIREPGLPLPSEVGPLHGRLKTLPAH